jgi:hypothetical protein
LGLAKIISSKESVEAPKELTPKEKTEQLLNENNSLSEADSGNEGLQNNKNLLEQIKTLLITTPLTQDHLNQFKEALKGKF